MSTAPLPAELTSLIALHEHHSALLTALNSTLAQHQQGNPRMSLPVELIQGTGMWVEGVVEDTTSVIISLGLQDIWLELPLEKALQFVGKRCGQLERRIEARRKEEERVKRDVELVRETLIKALELGEGDDGTSIDDR